MPSDMSKNHSIGSKTEILIKTEDLKVIYGNSVVGLESTNLAFFNNEISLDQQEEVSENFIKFKSLFANTYQKPLLNSLA